MVVRSKKFSFLSYLVVSTLFCTLFVPSLRAAQYQIDLSHSFIQFRTQHLGYSWLLGRFNKFEGAFEYDPDSWEGAQNIQLTIDVGSVDSNWAERDKHLRGKDFFDVEKYPTATFESTRFVGDSDGGKLSGNLTLRGVTKLISFDVKKIGAGSDPWGGYRAGFEGSYILSRKDFNMDQKNLGPAAEKVEVYLFIEGIRKE